VNLLEKIGEGLSCSSKLQAEGELVFVKSVEDVISLFDTATGKICLVEEAGTTTLGPILSDLSGVLCTTGSAGSHLAIVSREFGLPCIMGVRFSLKDLNTLNGKKCKIMTDEANKGIVFIEN
jgi:phosphoenolpyruvate synthase/pyruvate phosphate dikinase